MESVLLILVLVLVAANLVLLVLAGRKKDDSQQKEQLNTLLSISNSLARIEQNLKEDFRVNREEINNLNRDNRQELSTTLHNVKSEINEVLREKFNKLDESQRNLLNSNEQKLEQMRVTVDEKLQKTLNERLSQSFEVVSGQLDKVQKGLGEMQNLAQDVGGLKKVLSNVKMRGGIGEVQLSMLLEQILAPDQYAANVVTKKHGTEVVEFAIRLPGKDEYQTTVWLPVDAKFPAEVYAHLQDAYDEGDIAPIEAAQKTLEITIKKMAKDICEKYIEAPYTTNFAIMFLPFEGIYAEVVRKASLLEDLQRNYKVIVTGPSTFAAILNSLQMGFRTLAIQKRSSEVWRILGSVKTEFEKFGGMLEKAQKNIQMASNTIDEVMGKRTRAIQRKLKDIEIDNSQQELLVAITDDPEESEE
jgi:DNA anti-recombination protein RmuC